MNTLEPIWRAIGLPCPDAPLGPRSSASWRRGVTGLFLFAGLQPMAVTPGWVWRRLHCVVLPPSLSWATLLSGWTSASSSRLRKALSTTPSSSSGRLGSWNLNWLSSSITDRAQDKWQLVEQRLLRGQVMCLQETHWETHDQALWTQSLLVKHIFASCTVVPDECRRPGADNSRKGGVATLLPAGYHFTKDKCFVLVPGHATLTEINGPGCKWLVLNTYLRPEDPASTWQLILASPYFPHDYFLNDLLLLKSSTLHI